MKEVYCAADIVDAQMIKDYLEAAGIEAVVQGGLLTGIIGEIPVNTYPTVWVVEDDDYERARRLVDDYQHPEPAGQLYQEGWTCPECGQRLDAQFTQCWNCGTQRR